LLCFILFITLVLLLPTVKSTVKTLPARTTKIANVSGAGDTVIATLTTMLAAGADLKEACTLANYAASVVVEDVSIIPITRDALYDRLLEADVVISN